MKRVERLSEEWLRANDWDYKKYGDRRADRSAYDGMMNYEISSVLDDAFQAGYQRALEDAAKICDSTDWPLYADAIAIRIRALASADDPE